MLGISGTFTEDANATGNSIIDGYTAYAKGIKIEGRLKPQQEAFLVAELEFQIKDGYYSSTTAEIDGSCVDAAIIKKDVDILGVIGEYTGCNCGGGGGSSGSGSSDSSNPSPLPDPQDPYYCGNCGNMVYPISMCTCPPGGIAPPSDDQKCPNCKSILSMCTCVCNKCHRLWSICKGTCIPTSPVGGSSSSTPSTPSLPSTPSTPSEPSTPSVLPVQDGLVPLDCQLAQSHYIYFHLQFQEYRYDYSNKQDIQFKFRVNGKLDKYSKHYYTRGVIYSSDGQFQDDDAIQWDYDLNNTMECLCTVSEISLRYDMVEQRWNCNFYAEFSDNGGIHRSVVANGYACKTINNALYVEVPGVIQETVIRDDLYNNVDYKATMSLEVIKSNQSN